MFGDCECDFIYTFLSALWAIVGAAIAAPICLVVGRRIHPIERAKRGAKRDVSEFVYRGPGGGR